MRTPRRRKVRAAMFVGLGCSALIPLIHALILLGYDDVNRRISMAPWMLVEWSLQLLGGFLYAVRYNEPSKSTFMANTEQTRIPERFSPGSFDVWGGSHQIFHVLIVIASCLHAVAIFNAFHFAHTSERC